MFRRIKEKQQAAAKASPDNRLTAICGGCGEQYEYQCIRTAPRSRRHCSDRCRSRVYQARWAHDWRQETSSCTVCGDEMPKYGGGRVRMFCSAACKAEAHKENAARRERERSREAKAVRAAEEIRAFQESPSKCADCGCDQTWELRRRMRCEACQKKHASATTMARYYSDEAFRQTMLDHARTRNHRMRDQAAGASVDWREVMERDGWKCRRCGVKTSEGHRIGHPRKAVLGHIYALSAGGEHSYSNVCCLCHSCNVADGVNKVAIQYHLEVASHG
jgi:hypothetical protein